MASRELDDVFREEWPRILATLIRFTGSIELAEDAVQEAFARAAASRDRELLINPAAWVTAVARRIAIDTARRDAALRERLPKLVDDRPQLIEASPGGDDRLGLLFVACAPELAGEARLALSLRFVCGIPTERIADAMLVQHTALSARLTRAKQRIERDGIRFSPLDEVDFDARLADVLGTIHLLYTIGHTALDGDELTSTPVTTTAVQLARALRALLPADPEVAGLLALLLFAESRAAARTSADGSVVSLEDVDRSTWDAALIAEGLDLVTEALPGRGRLALEAGIAGLHCSAADFASTDWDAIATLYDGLVSRWPSPAAKLARVVARSYRRGGAAPALDELDALESELGGATARQADAARADILRRLGRIADARAAYVRARSIERNGPVREFFSRRIADLDGSAEKSPTAGRPAGSRSDAR